MGSGPVTVGEMTSDLGQRVREAVLTEVIAMVDTVRTDRHVPLDDELDYFKALVIRERERATA